MLIHFKSFNVKKERCKNLLSSGKMSTVNYDLIIIYSRKEEPMYFKYSVSASRG